VDVIPPDTGDLSAYRMVLVPGVATLTAPFLAALARFPGVALIGPRTNAKTPEFATPVPLPPNLPGLDAVVARVESLPPDVPVPLARGGQFLHWREKLEGTADVVEVAEDGWPALVRAGGIHYLAGWPDDPTLDRIVSEAARGAGIDPDPLPEGLRRRDSATHRFWFNYNPVPVEWGGVTIPPAGVHWHLI
jgi:beta-galactosidase